ncbi:MAG: RecX family transcriptional regulator [Flavobacteriaceae bacterium]|nr:RecX family transcriptional regulator [Flavobacteriaceae bacterium]
MHINRKTYTLAEALTKLQHFCAYQERCHQDVYDKLKGMHMIPEAIDQIIVVLIQDNYLNEERFSKAFVMGKFRIKKWGRQRLILELKKRHITMYLIEKAIAEISEAEYLETLDALARKRCSSIRETNALKRKKKLADYLLYRGWESHLVYEKVNALID